MVAVDAELPGDETAAAAAVSQSRSSYRPDVVIKIIPKRFINIYSYTALLSIVQFWYSFYLAYTIAALTTLERRYGMPSLYSGIFLASFELGHLTIIIFSFTETNCHIPRRLAIRSLFMSLGAFLITTPHILVPVASDVDRLQQKTDNSSITPASLQCHDPTLTPNKLPFRNCTVEEIGQELGDATKGFGEAIWAMIILTLAQGIVATASSTYSVIGVLYIDNNVDKERSSAFIGTVYSMMMLGPAAAFFFSSGVAASIYVHPFEIDPPDPNSTHFVGAWWSGFLLSSAMFLLVSPLFLLFPKKLEKKEFDETTTGPPSKNTTIRSTMTEISTTGCDTPSVTESLLPSSSNDKTKQQQEDVEAEPFTLRTLPSNFLILFRNTMFLALVFLACAQIYITAGYFTFYPKYIEAQFKQPVWIANLVSGIANPIPCAIGTFLGGLLMSKLKLSQANALISTLTLATIVAIGLLFMSGLQCESDPIVGMDFNEGFQGSIFTNNAQSCDYRCGNCAKKYDPVCGSDGRTYASPCHAGCQHFDAAKQTYRDCGCISNNGTLGTAVPEKCQPENFWNRFCTNFFIYNALAFILAVLIIMPSTPMTIIMMRVVGPKYKSWAIGLTSSFCSFLSFIPAPVIFGSVFDAHCLLWDESDSGFSVGVNASRCDPRSIKNEDALLAIQAELLNEPVTNQRNCLFYETNSLAIWFHCLTSAFLFISLPANFYVWWKCRENEMEETRLAKVNSAIINKEITAATEIEMSNQRVL